MDFFCECRVETGEIDVLLQIVRYNVDGGVGIVIIQMYINDFIWVMSCLRPKDKDYADKPQTKARLTWFGEKEVLSNKTHEQVGIGQDHMGTHEVLCSLHFARTCSTYLSL